MATVFLPTVGAVGPAGPPGPATKGAPPRYWVWLDPNNGNKATAYDTHNGLPLVPTGTTDVALAAVVTALGGTNGTVALSGDTHTLLADPNLPANVCLQMPYGAVLSHSSYSLTIGGPVDAGPYQIFAGTGTVSLSTYVPEAWGDWWGAKGDGATDDSTALNAAIAAVAPVNGLLRLRSRKYAVASTVNAAKYKGWKLRGMGATGDDNLGTTLLWTGTSGGTVLFLNYQYDVVVEDLAIIPSADIGIGIDIDASGTSTDPNTSSHVTLHRVRVAPDSSGSGHTLGTALRIGHSGQGNCDRMRLYDCYFGGIGGNTITTGIELDYVNVKIVDMQDTQFGYSGTGILRNNGGFTLIKPEFESNTVDIQLNANNDPLQMVSPNTENSTQFLVVPFTTAPIIVSIDGGRLDSNAATGNFIDFAARGLLMCRGTSFSPGTYTTTPKLYLHNGGTPGTVGQFDGCVFASDQMFVTTNYADILLHSCVYTDGSGSAVRIPDGRIVAGSGMLPAAAAGANAGGSPPSPVVVAGGNDTRFAITCGTGSSPAAGDQVDVTFSQAYILAQNPQVVVSPTNAASAALQPYVTLRTSGGAVIGCSVNTALAPAGGQPNTTYGFAVVVSG